MVLLKTISWKYLVITAASFTLIFLNIFPIYLTKDSWAFTPPRYSSGGEAYEGTLSSLAISKDGDYIIAGGRNVFYFSKNSPTPIWTYTPQEFEIAFITAAISDDGNLMALGSSNGLVLFFEGSKSIPLWKHIGGQINSIDISGNGDYIAVATKINLLFFTKNNSTPLWSYSGSQDFVEITSNGNYIFAGNDNKIAIFSKSSPTPLWIFKVSSNIKDMAVNDNGKTIIVGCGDKMIYLFENFNPIPKWSYLATDLITDVATSSTGEILAVSGNNDYLYNDYLYLFSNSSSLPLWTYHFTSNWDLGYSRTSISGDGNYIVFNKDKYLKLFHCSSNKPIWEDEHGRQSWSWGEAKPLISHNGNYISTILDGNLYLYYRLNPLMSIDFENYYLWIYIFAYPCLGIFTTLILYRQIRKRKRKRILETLIKSSDKIRVEMLLDILNMNEKVFYKNISSLVSDFGLKLDGDYLIIDKDRVQELIDNLLNVFKEWEKTSKYD